MIIYQQAGHNTTWNIQSFEEDNACDGIIFSPVHKDANSLEKVSSKIKKVSLFDPQFYVPDSQKSKLNSYDFFPEKITAGFSTRDYYAVANKSAKLCLDFQINNEFKSLIIPCRYFPDMVSNYIEKQKVFSVEPFLSEVDRRKNKKKIYLTLPVTIAMVSDEEFRVNILNWITSYREIDGVYLLVSFNESTKQLQDYYKLKAYMDFINELSETGLNIICGYCNTEGVLLSLLNIEALTVGAYENTRGFSIDKFLDDDKIKHGPAARIYFPKLLNWMRYSTAVEIKEDHPKIWEKIYTYNDYTEKVFLSKTTPHFNNPNLYKAHFQLKADLYRDILKYKGDERIKHNIKIIKKAIELYSEIKESGVVFFDKNCQGDHLLVWNRIVKKMLPSS